jgi:hypothetical protein
MIAGEKRKTGEGATDDTPKSNRTNWIKKELASLRSATAGENYRGLVFFFRFLLVLLSFSCNSHVFRLFTFKPL